MKLTIAQQAFYYFAWAVSCCLQAAIAILILRRKQTRVFPIFFTYTVFHVIQALLSFVAYRISYTFYFYEWWTGELLDALITLAVLQEIFSVTFRPYDALRAWGTRLYVTVVIILCFVSVLMAMQHSHGDQPQIVALLTLQRSATFMQMGLLLFLFVFCRLFGMSWRHYVFGISSGLALMASIVTIGVAMRIHMGRSAEPWVGMFESAGFCLGVVVWAYYFASAKSRVPLDHVPGTERLIAWNQALGDIGRR